MTKTWFITGTSSGIGHLLAQRALMQGDYVIATARNLQTLAELKAQYPERLLDLVLELTDTSSIRQAVDAAFSWAGRIDVVVSNAGYGLVGAAEELSDEQIARQLATNLTGSIQFIRAVLPHLRGQGGGRIVQVSSEGGQVAYPGFSLYHASKWGVEGFIEAVAQEVAGFGIDFMLAEPGPTDTRFGASIDYAQEWSEYVGTPADEVRNAVRSGSFPMKGDAQRTVDILMRAIGKPKPPFRLALGSTAYEHIHLALSTRLQALDAQKSEAYAADKQLS